MRARTIRVRNDRSRCSAFLPLLVVGLLGTASPLLAQDSSDAEEPTDTYFEAVDVQVVNVDVYVTDKSTGERVRGLTKDDFEIFEDGRPVAVSNFLAVEDGRPLGLPEIEADAPETIPLGDLPDLRLEKKELPPEQQLHVVVYIDNLFLQVFSRNRAIRQIRTFLQDRLREGDRVMIATFQRSLRIRQPFTTDYSVVAEILNEIETEQGFEQQGETQRREVIRDIEFARTAYEAMARVELHADSIYDDAGRSIDKLREMVGSLAGLPGRKAILHVSDGIPMTPAADLFEMIANKWQDQISLLGSGNRYRLAHRYHSLTTLASSHRVSFYTLEAAGLRSHRSLSAEYGGSTSGAQPGSSFIQADHTFASNRQETLQLLAHDTGGLSAFNTNNIAGALGRMEQDFENWYSLAYHPARTGDGRYHDIEVKVKRRGVEVRHRNGYRDRSLEARVNEETLASLIHGVERDDLGIDVRLGQPVRHEDRWLVSVDVRIPIGALTLLPYESIHRGRLRVAVAAKDGDGELSEIDQKLVPLDIPADDLETAKTQYFTYTAQLLMEDGNQTVAVGVQDDTSRERSMVRSFLRVGR